MKRLSWLVTVLLLPVSLLNAQLVFPGAEGFGANQRSAYSGSATPRVLMVNSLLDTSEGSESEGRGTLRWCLTRTYPRIVLFEVGGTIRLEDLLEIDSPYLFVAGQSAPSPGILVTNSTVVIRTHHVLFQHLSFRAGDDPDSTKPESRDCLSIFREEAHDVCIDHCSMLWGIDEVFSTWAMGEPITNFTVSNSIIAQGLNYSISPDGGHSKGLLIGYGTSNISILKNFIAHNDDRNPLLNGGTDSEVINNLLYNAADGVSFNGHDEFLTHASVINNYIRTGLDITDFYVARFIWMNHGSGVYLSGNSGTANDWDFIRGNSLGQTVRVDDPPILSGRVHILPRDEVEAYVLESVGSRPWDRNEADLQVLEDYRNGVGRIVDCVDAEEIRYNPGTAVAGTHNTITLADEDPGKDRAYEFKDIEILAGTGAGQRRDVVSYDQETNVLTISPDWQVVPGAGSEYIMIVNCENNAGGWRLLSPSRRAPLVPDDPHGDSNANGYTNIEEWLYTLNPMAGVVPEETETRYSLYPNPSDGTLTLEFAEAVPAASAVMVTSMTGATVAHIELEHPSPGDSLLLDLSMVGNGVYVVGVQYSDRVVSRKIVVL